MLPPPQERDPAAESRMARTFATTLALACVVAALWPAGSTVRGGAWLLGAGGALAISALVPALAIPLARAWIRFGTLIGHVVAPISMGIVFFLAVTPTGLALRALGKDPLRLRRDTGAATYWIERPDIGPSPGDFRRQF